MYSVPCLNSYDELAKTNRLQLLLQTEHYVEDFPTTQNAFQARMLLNAVLQSFRHPIIPVTSRRPWIIIGAASWTSLARGVDISNQFRVGLEKRRR